MTSVFFGVFFAYENYLQTNSLDFMLKHPRQRKNISKNADTDWNFTISFRHSYFSSGFTKHIQKSCFS